MRKHDSSHPRRQGASELTNAHSHAHIAHNNRLACQRIHLRQLLSLSISLSLSLSLSLSCFLSRFGAPGNAQVGLPAPLSQGWIFFRAFVFQYIGCAPPTTLRPSALHGGKRSPQTSCKGRFVVVGACLGEGGGRWIRGGCPVCGPVVP